ncbi:hypothetical protein, partial [Lentilactobacillus hilgardii]
AAENKASLAAAASAAAAAKAAEAKKVGTPATASSSSTAAPISSTSSSAPYVSVGTTQTTIDSTFNIEGYSQATGGKQVAHAQWTIPLWNGNVNWNNAVNTFNRDRTVMGDKKDVIPSNTLKAALKNDGFNQVYMKITPTILPRLAGGWLDNVDSLTGVYMKFNLDTDSIPSNVHYGDTVRLGYTVDDSALYTKSAGDTKNENSSANADGYIGMTIYRQWVKTILDMYVVNPYL